MNKFLLSIAAILTASVLLISFVSPSVRAIDPAVCENLQKVDDTVDCGSGIEAKITPIGNNIISILTYLIGALSVIAMLYGGIRFVISNGDQNAVKQSKDIILYAVVGLAVAIFAQVVVSYVLSNL